MFPCRPTSASFPHQLSIATFLNCSHCFMQTLSHSANPKSFDFMQSMMATFGKTFQVQFAQHGKSFSTRPLPQGRLFGQSRPGGVVYMLIAYYNPHKVIRGHLVKICVFKSWGIRPFCCRLPAYLWVGALIWFPALPDHTCTSRSTPSVCMCPLLGRLKVAHSSFASRFCFLCFPLVSSLVWAPTTLWVGFGAMW